MRPVAGERWKMTPCSRKVSLPLRDPTLGRETLHSVEDVREVKSLPKVAVEHFRTSCDEVRDYFDFDVAPDLSVVVPWKRGG